MAGEQVLVLGGGGVAGIAWMTGLLAGLADAGLQAGGADVMVIEPDQASREAMGANPLDPAARTPAAQAGRSQGRGGLLQA
jgi:NTE family protein